MLVAGVTQFRAKLSEYLAAVKGGEAVLITERGEPVAVMIPEGIDPAKKARLLRLVRELGDERRRR